MKLPTTTWVPGEGARPDDAWLDDVEPDLLVDVGVHLFERGQGFEAHEAWERAWRSAKNRGDLDLERMLRALIKLAAASVKVRQKNSQGVRDHAGGARALLEELVRDGVLEVGRVCVAPLLEMATRVESMPPLDAAESPVGKPMFGRIQHRASP